MRAVGGAILLTLVGLLAADARAQRLPAEEWRALVGANEQFGRRLLQQVHSSVPERNAVVSPLPLSLIMAAVQSSAGYEVADEIGSAFGWGTARRLTVPAHMLLAAFERADRLPNAAYPAEETWIENRVLYRSAPIPGATHDPVRAGRPTLADLFLSRGKKYFAIEFEAVGATQPTDAMLRRSAETPIPSLSEPSDVLISSNLHLATAWAGNTFSMSKPFTGRFRTESGVDREVAMLKSEMSIYRHAKTPTFEVVELPCNRGYMLAVLPPPGKPIQELELELVRSPESVDAALKKEFGSVILPLFHTKAQSDLAPQLKQMGIRRVFTNLGDLFTIPGSHVNGVQQIVDIEVDRSGIRADAGTVVSAIYGGMMGGLPEPFSMELDRPFVYLIRERFTDALLFAGVVVDPSLK